MKTELQIAQNKCIRFCFYLPPRRHISPSHFKGIDWLPVKRKLELCTSTTVFKYWKRIAPCYLNGRFVLFLFTYSTRSQITLDILFCRTNKGQKSMSFLGPKIWNWLNSNIKAGATAVSFAHGLKK